ncbi:MAG TPA: Lrp/AsnC ligand binding domain-containing protein [Actinomycetota bacterium]|nr:Lrp/AsnC ligand binding domain-containing protein [Actinomycetota bacterium]
MDAYVLLQTGPGLATTVMNALVESEVVDRALCITGDADVFARVNDVDWPDLKDRLLNKLQRVPGVVRSSTHVVVPTGAVARGAVPRHPVFVRIADEKTIHALVFVQIAAGSARETVRAVRDMKGLLGLAVVTGEYDLILQVAARSIDQLATTVLQQIHTIPGVTSTKTSLILAATPLRERKTRARKPARRRRKR